MKDERQIKQQWEMLATSAEFEDCMQDLIRKSNFWKPQYKHSSEELQYNAGMRSLVTYILKKTGMTSIDVNMPNQNSYED